MQFLFFEGAPGSGKSSFSEYCAIQYQQQGQAMRWYEEHELDQSFFNRLYDLLENRPQAALEELLKFWQLLIDRQESACFDGVFFHCSIKLLYAFGWSEQQIFDYLDQLYPMLEAYQPRLIWLRQSTADSLAFAIAQRGEEWGDAVAEAVNNDYPIQVQRKLQGRSGLVQFFNETQDLLGRIIEKSPFDTLIIDVSGQQWATYQQILCEWLKLPQTPIFSDPDLDLSEYNGKFMPPDSFPLEFRKMFEVELIDDELRLHMGFMRNFRLRPLEPDSFAIIGRPQKLRFHRDSNGTIIGAIYPFVQHIDVLCNKIG